MSGARWRLDAACAGHDPDLWFPGRGGNGKAAAAIMICAGCPVSTQCLEYALAEGIQYGIYGGVTANVRDTMRARLGMTGRRFWRAPEPCGTDAAYRRHLRRSEPVDAACAAAGRRSSQARYEARAQRAELASQLQEVPG